MNTIKVIDSWSGGASGFRRLEYRVVFDGQANNYHLEYQINGGEWTGVGDSDGHRVAKGLAAMVIREDLRVGRNERRLA